MFRNFINKYRYNNPRVNQSEIAEKLGISRQAVSMYIKGDSKPSFEDGYCFMVRLEASDADLREYVGSYFSDIKDVDLICSELNKALRYSTTEKPDRSDPLPIYKKNDGKMEIIGYVVED